MKEAHRKNISKSLTGRVLSESHKEAISKAKMGHKVSEETRLKMILGRKKNGFWAKHNLSRHPLYRVWSAMMARCHNPNDRAYKWYGARGISVCERWHDVSKFIEDVSPIHSMGSSMDRFNNDGNYELQNIRFVSRKVNMRNIRANKLVTFKGETRALAEWTDILALNYKTVWDRLKRGWSVERSFTS